MFDVAVLGVGGMGAAALAHLAGRGLRVVGIEQDDVPSLRGSSVGQTRIIRKAYYEDARYVPLLHRAYELWHELEPELYVRTGCLNLGPPDHADIRGVLESAQMHGLPHERLAADAVRERFPAFVPARGDIGIYEEDAGYLRVEACTKAHANLALACGATLRTRAKVTGFALEGTSVRITLDTGEDIEAKQVVVSAGAWLASPLFAELAADLPALTVTRQVQLWFEPRDAALARAPRMPAFIHFVGGDKAYYGLPLIDESPGIKVCRHHGGELTRADALDRDVRQSDEDDVRAYIDAHLPVAGRRAHAQPCMYTSTPDYHFVIGRHPRHEEVIVLGGFSGHGYKMASVVGEIAAELVVDGRTQLDIDLFSPSRPRTPNA